MDLSTNTNLDRKDLATDFAAGAHITVNIEIVQLVFKILLVVLGQSKALNLLSTKDHCEDDRTSLADSSWSVDVREEFRAAQAVVGEPDTEIVILHRGNGVTESGGRASWDFLSSADHGVVGFGLAAHHATVPLAAHHLHTSSFTSFPAHLEAADSCILSGLHRGREKECGKGGDSQN
jgi:hypothetical protein